MLDNLIASSSRRSSHVLDSAWSSRQRPRFWQRKVPGGIEKSLAYSR